MVYKARDTRLDRTVALKFLHPHTMHDDESKCHFIREGRVIASLNHPNIATIYDIAEIDSQLFIVMEFYGGKTLQKRIKDEKFEISDAIQFSLQIAAGLNKSHVKNIIHRDIKPGNIIFSEDNEVKIIDFGLAKLKDNSLFTETGTILGTAAYMSPEQVHGGTVDQRTDIWSLGVILYEMLSGQRPFAGEYEQAVMYSILNEEPEFTSKFPGDISSQIEKIIRKSLQKNPEKRYGSIDEMQEVLENLLEELETEKNRTLPIFRLGRKNKRLIYKFSSIILILSVSTLLFWIDFSPKNKPVSIALLPIENLSGNRGQEWFTDGMTDALITDLARISGLRIISRSSVMKYKGTDKTASEIAAELGVDYVIEASVFEMDNQVRISTRLIDPSNDEYIWAHEYNRDFRNILLLQGELAEAIAGQIEVQLTPYEQTILSDRYVVDPEAYEAHLKGNYYWFQLTPQSLEIAENYYKLAVEIDPGYAMAYGGIALSYLGRAQMGYVSFLEVGEQAEVAAQTALEMDSTLAEVHYMLGVLNTWGNWNWKKAENEFKKAIELNPNLPEAKVYYSHLLFFLNRPDEALYQVQNALELDPFNPLFHALYGMDLMYLRRYDDVILLLEKNLETSPRDLVSLTTLIAAYHQKGMFDKEIETWRKVYDLKGDREAIGILNDGYDRAGYKLALRSVAELFIERSKTTYVTPWQIATLHARIGMKETALEYLDKAYEEHDPNMPYLSVSPIFDYMRDDPNFIELIEKMGLQDQSLTSNIFQ